MRVKDYRYKKKRFHPERSGSLKVMFEHVNISRTSLWANNTKELEVALNLVYP